MIDGQKVLAVIPARGGSKGIPRKNIRSLGGKALIQWAFDAARASRHIDRTIVSTEDQEIAAVALGFGCEVPFMRPAELALDTTPGIDPVLHVIDRLPEYPIVVLLQPTSPLRTAEDIDACIEKCAQTRQICMTVSEVAQNPFWMYRFDERQRLVPLITADKMITRRQDAPGVYAANGAVYSAFADRLKTERSYIGPETIGVIMPRERSLDIDTPLDWDLAELMLGKQAFAGN